MKLNPDCIRDILICVESAGFDEPVEFKEIIEKLHQYEEETILYHINQCDYNDFFTGIRRYECGYEGIIFDLTPKAHEFLANIRSDNLWKKTKTTASKVGSFALPILQNIASNLAELAIKATLSSSDM